ncbi:MAG: uroporphyrinogen-III synthase [Pontixanthobacter sp.]
MNGPFRRPVLIVRPEPGCRQTVTRAHDLGLDAHGHPLFTIEPAGWEAPDPAQYDALLIGSANVLRHGGDRLGRYRHLPVFAVGKSTAIAAQRLGFHVEHIGSGGLQSVITAHGRKPRTYLRLGGEERVELTLPDGQSMHECTVYRAEPCKFGEPVRELLQQRAIVALHSAAAARQLRQELSRLQIDTGTISIATLGPRIAAAAGMNWARIESAARPSDGALLELVAAMCQ